MVHYSLLNERRTAFRTGGSSFIPAVQTLLENKFGRDKVRQEQVFTGVVSGLALAGRSIF